MQKVALILLAFTVSSGCHRQDLATSGSPEKVSAAPASSQLSPEQAAQIESQFLEPATPTSAGRKPATIEDRLNGSVHAQLTAKLRIFKAVRGRMPENFYELANTVGDSVPLLPDGMKFMIDPVDQTVKAVRK